MSWVVFVARFDCDPAPGVHMTFKPDLEPVLVTTAVAQAAIAAAAATPAKRKGSTNG